MKHITRENYVDMMMNRASKSKSGRIRLYTVQESILGLNKPVQRWFSSYEDAARYARRDYTDNPVRHTYTDCHARGLLYDMWAYSTREELWRSLGEF